MKTSEHIVISLLELIMVKVTTRSDSTVAEKIMDEAGVEEVDVVHQENTRQIKYCTSTDNDWDSELSFSWTLRWFLSHITYLVIGYIIVLGIIL